MRVPTAQTTPLRRPYMWQIAGVFGYWANTVATALPAPPSNGKRITMGIKTKEERRAANVNTAKHVYDESPGSFSARATSGLKILMSIPPTMHTTSFRVIEGLCTAPTRLTSRAPCELSSPTCLCCCSLRRCISAAAHTAQNANATPKKRSVALPEGWMTYVNTVPSTMPVPTQSGKASASPNIEMPLHSAKFATLNTTPAKNANTNLSKPTFPKSSMDERSPPAPEPRSMPKVSAASHAVRT
mmetsp:Transcript_20593/g.57259  ORF Transcript_20593/g.57259 Transcript_20593/m.57259 type:complete len:243 (+) Transcript_20593:364-1092(+)